VDNKRTDISQIWKYLNGELDSTAMHRLEREAQDDPFLMDALEGFEKSEANQQTNLSELQKHLQQRVNKKEARIIPFWYWGVAASILIIAGIGGLWYKYNAAPQKTLVAQADKTQMWAPLPVKPAEKENPDAEPLVLKQPTQLYNAKKPSSIAAFKPKLKNGPVAATPPLENEVIAAMPDHLKEGNVSKVASNLTEAVVTGLTSEKSKELLAVDTKVAIDTSKKYQVSLDSRVKGVQVNPNYNALKHPVVISGIVIGKDDGLPIPGVNIRVLGTTAGTQTDANGKFVISGAKGKTVSVASLGYKTEQVDLKGKDSLNIALSADSKALSEVVVVGYSNSVDHDIPQYKARPKQGWDSFKKYLKANSVVTDGTEGSVKLQFTVNQYGQISDIKILKSLNASVDAKAIDLIKNGPGWFGNTNNKPEVVKVKVDFRKGK
jgi:TonB family protein